MYNKPINKDNTKLRRFALQLYAAGYGLDATVNNGSSIYNYDL
jgi:hypothetical protein